MGRAQSREMRMPFVAAAGRLRSERFSHPSSVALTPAECPSP